MNETSQLAAHADVASNLALLEIWLQAQMAYSGVPAVTVAIVHDQELVYANGFGFADLEHQRPAEPDTIFRIASHSKLFTAVAMMQLRDQGKLHLDDPLMDYLPWFAPEKAFAHNPDITLRHLLTHTAGLPREAGSGYWVDFDFPTTAELMARAPNLGQKYPTETKRKYSNLALALAGEVITAVSGQPYADYIQQNILDPLGMTSTSVLFPEAHQARLATGYGRRMPDMTRETLPFVDARGLAAAAGLSSTVLDMARFVAWQLRLRDSDATEILKASTLREMQRPQWVEDDWQSAWGLGFSITHKEARDLIGHGGGYPGYLTRTWISPAEKLGVIVFTNALDAQPMLIAERIFEWLAPAIKKAVDGDPGREPDPAWANLQGTYRERWADVHVLFLDGSMKLIYPTETNPKAGAFTLEPDGEQRFILRGDGGGPIGEAVLFETDADGRAVRIKVGESWMKRVSY